MKTPYFLIDESQIERNCKILERVRKEGGCKILLAQKAYSCYDTYPLIAKYLDGTTASGLFEARLGYLSFRDPRTCRVEESQALAEFSRTRDSSGLNVLAPRNDKEVHCFAPAFTDQDMAHLVKICDHIVFNSKAQLLKHHAICRKHGLSISVRVNPEFKTQDSDIYDPCAPFSRFGIRACDFDDEIASLIDGIHFHTLCEQDLEPLKLTLAAFEQKFGKYLAKMKTINFGGGHHITRDGYDVDGLITLIRDFRARHNNIQVYLEPGEAIVLDAGTLHATVLDIVHNERAIAILDTSAACHNPDILETGHDYMPPILGATLANAQSNSHVIARSTATKQSQTDPHLYRLAGNTCLSGDIIGDYIFQNLLNIGDQVTFQNMALYTMVKTNMFNGINLPSIYVKRLNGKVELIREFGYNDYITRLGKKGAIK
jgi:carboxynorspermidine decarboxylase